MKHVILLIVFGIITVNITFAKEKTSKKDPIILPAQLASKVTPAENDNSGNFISGGAGASLSTSIHRLDEKNEISSRYGSFTMPVIDAEFNMNFSKIFSFVLRGSAGTGINQRNQNEIFIEATPMLSVQPFKNIKVGAGVKFKRGESPDNYVYSSTAIYGEVRTELSKSTKLDGYFGIAKNIEDAGYGFKAGVIKNFGRNY